MAFKYDVEVGIAFGGDHGQWDTLSIEVRVEDGAEDDTIETAALHLASKRVVGQDVAHMWIHFWTPDEAEKVDDPTNEVPG